MIHLGSPRMLTRFAALALACMVTLAGCNDVGPLLTAGLVSPDTTKAPLKRISKRVDPATLRLEPGHVPFISHTILDDGTEVGIITMKNGSTAKYWFRSHHLDSGSIGGTWFAFDDGTRLYMSGYFCCNVDLPGGQPSEPDDLKRFIWKHHGTSP